MSRSEKRGRIVEVDILKGLGILLMVFDHVGWGIGVHTYIQSFHMPLFFIVSGYLWRPCDDLGTFARKRFRTLMVPYLCFSLFYLVFSSLLHLAGLWDARLLDAVTAITLFPTDMYRMPIASALWFLPCLYLSSVTYAFLGRFERGMRTAAVLAIAVAGMAYSSLSEAMLPFALEPVATGLLFLMVGDYLSPKDGRPAVVRRMGTGLLILALALHAALAFLNKAVDMRSARYYNCALYVLVAVLGTVVWWAVSARLARQRGSLRGIPTRVLEGLSVNSLDYLCMNQPAIGCMLFVMGSLLPEGASRPAAMASKFLVFVGAMCLCHVAGLLIRRSPFAFALGRMATKSLPET